MNTILSHQRSTRSAPLLLAIALLPCFSAAATEPRGGSPPNDDHQHMMDELGIKSLRPGANPKNQATFNEASANPYKDSMPQTLRMRSGARVTTPEAWRQRRKEILEDFEREVYGRVPANAPTVTWKIVETSKGETAGVETITKVLEGRLDNSAYPALEVKIAASFTVPAGAKEPVPVILSYEGAFARTGRTVRRPAVGAPWTEQAIAHGWGYGWINPLSIQPDNNQLQTGVIGLCNKGQPRKPDDWGVLRAWAWGVSQLVDYFEQHPDAQVDATKVGVEGVSRFGKAALVAQAFDERIAVGFIASSGQGGAKLHRHVFGEAVENLAGGLSYWMAGNYIKYASADPLMTAADLPVDSHELIALCAPRPCFVSYGTVAGGDPPWVDAHGSFMACVLASPVYELLGAHGLDANGDYVNEPMPPVGKLVGGQLAWRQHEGGHTAAPNWPAFFQWVSQYVKAPAQRSTVSTGKDELAGVHPKAFEPAPRTDENSKQAHQDLLKKARLGATTAKIDVYFVGDSITRRWGSTDPQYRDLFEHWKKNFYGWNAADFGWGGDTTSNILWRLQHGELEGLKPKVFVILAGTNNLAKAPADGDADEIAQGVEVIIETCQRQAPDAKIILTAIFPRNDNRAALPIIRQINERIANYADGKRVRFLNVNEKLADAQGNLYEGMMMDGLHPTVRGYEVWAAGLRPILTEWLGPPATTDSAPPATGDPSAKRPS